MTPEEERKHLELKIDQVKKDIEAFVQSGRADNKVGVLTEYQEYLEDELKMLRAKIKGVSNG